MTLFQFISSDVGEGVDDISSNESLSLPTLVVVSANAVIKVPDVEIGEVIIQMDHLFPQETPQSNPSCVSGD